MARAGLCSRREAERWIEQGRVNVNGKRADEPALRGVGQATRSLVDGKPLPAAEPPRLWRYYKPRGLVTTHADPQGRPTVFDNLPEAAAARHLRRPARLQQRGPAAAHQRRRARPPPGAAGHRLAAPLPRARARPRHAGRSRQAEGRHRDRRRALRADRGDASTACRAPTPGSPSACARARTARCARILGHLGLDGEPPDPHLLRAVPAARPEAGRGRAGEAPRALPSSWARGSPPSSTSTSRWKRSARQRKARNAKRARAA